MILKYFNTINYTYILIIMFCAHISLGQTKISVEEAYVLALRHNPEMKIWQNNERYHTSMTNAIPVILPIQVSATAGQFNSHYTDNAFGISQEFHMPGYVAAKKALAQQKRNSSQRYRQWMEALLYRQLEMVHIRYQYMVEKKNLWLQKDSLLTIFLDKVSYQIKLGE